jgi:hypothetical protein
MVGAGVSCDGVAGVFCAGVFVVGGAGASAESEPQDALLQSATADMDQAMKELRGPRRVLFMRR